MTASLVRVLKEMPEEYAGGEDEYAMEAALEEKRQMMEADDKRRATIAALSRDPAAMAAQSHGPLPKQIPGQSPYGPDAGGGSWSPDDVAHTLYSQMTPDFVKSSDALDAVWELLKDETGYWPISRYGPKAEPVQYEPLSRYGLARSPPRTGLEAMTSAAAPEFLQSILDRAAAKRRAENPAEPPEFPLAPYSTPEEDEPTPPWGFTGASGYPGMRMRKSLDRAFSFLKADPYGSEGGAGMPDMNWYNRIATCPYCQQQIPQRDMHEHMVANHPEWMDLGHLGFEEPFGKPDLTEYNPLPPDNPANPGYQ